MALGLGIDTGGTYTDAVIYDFNNETGELPNYRQIPYPDSENVAHGLCFSPNNRFILDTCRKCISD